MSWKAKKTITLILSYLRIFSLFNMHCVFFYFDQYSCYLPSQETSRNHFRIPFNKQIFNCNEKLLGLTILANNSLYKIFIYDLERHFEISVLSNL